MWACWITGESVPAFTKATHVASSSLFASEPYLRTAPLCKLLMAIHLMTSSKKGISSHQIARECELTVKSAWFLTHRIREAMKLEPMAGMLQGVVECDEAYVGGKPCYRGVSKRGRGTEKSP